jgi:hypothetical protein
LVKRRKFSGLRFARGSLGRISSELKVLRDTRVQVRQATLIDESRTSVKL